MIPLIFFLSLAIALMILLRVASVYADISDYLNATIKISICGNDIIEGGEDCEGEDLNGETCESIGYGPGTLACDIACSFDTYSCSPAPTPTPTPSPTPTPTPTPVPSATTASPTPTTASTTTTSSPSPTTSESITPSIVVSPTIKPTLPTFLIPFDPDGDGIIALTEIFVAAKSWVEEWRQAVLEEIAQGEGAILTKKERKCDLNRDFRCDLKDFSVLLFYVKG